MLEKKYINILEKIVGIYKDFEHEKIKEVSGKTLDELIKGSEEYLERIKKIIFNKLKEKKIV